MEEIKVGEYVRTKEGYIAKLKEHLDNLGSYLFDNPIHTIESDKWTAISEKELEKQIVKHRPNPIDLIEEGDYVNGTEVIMVYGYDEDGNNRDELEICETDEDYAYYKYLKDINIYSIVTKEQFKSVEYVIEEDK